MRMMCVVNCAFTVSQWMFSALCSVHMCFNRKQSPGQPTQLLTKWTRALFLCLFSQVGISPLFMQQIPCVTWVVGSRWWDSCTQTCTQTKRPQTCLVFCTAPTESLFDRDVTVGQDEWGEVPKPVTLIGHSEEVERLKKTLRDVQKWKWIYWK